MKLTILKVPLAIVVMLSLASCSDQTKSKQTKLPESKHPDHETLVAGIRVILTDTNGTKVEKKDFNGRYWSLRFKPEEVAEMSSLLESYKQSPKAEDFVVHYLESLLKLAKTAGKPNPVPMNQRPRPPASTTERLVSTIALVAPGNVNATRFVPMPSSVTGDTNAFEFRVLSMSYVQQRLWAYVTYQRSGYFERKNERGATIRGFETLRHFGLWSMDADTLSNEWIPLGELSSRFTPNSSGPMTFKTTTNYTVVNTPNGPRTESVTRMMPVGAMMPPGFASPQRVNEAPSFEVTAESAFVLTAEGMRKYDFKLKALAPSSSELANVRQFAFIGGRLIAVSEEAVVEVDPSTDAVKVLASARRSPAATLLDQEEKFSDPLVFDGGRKDVCVIANRNVYRLKSGGLDWERVGKLDERISWSPVRQPEGRLLLSQQNKRYDVPPAVGVVAPSSTSAGAGLIFLMVAPATEKPPPIGPPGSSPPPLDRSNLTGVWDGTSLWLACGKMPDGQTSPIPSASSEVELFSYNGGPASQPVKLPVQLVLPAGMDDRDRSSGAIGPQMPPIRLGVTSKFLAIGYGNVAGVWLIRLDEMKGLGVKTLKMAQNSKSKR